MTEDERQMNHFNRHVRECQHREKPQLQYEPGCWKIDCGEGCKCAMSDGDHPSPGPLTLRWLRRHG
jgi:hypothetical protein